LKPSTKNTGSSDWVELAEGVYRWVIGKPEIKWFDGSEKPSIQFPLRLTDSETTRYKAEYGEAEAGKQQSYRPAFGGHTVGMSLGWYDKAAAFQTTNLVDFLTACMGFKNQKAMRSWIEAGACPDLDEAMSAEEQEAAIVGWLGYIENMEILGSIAHRPNKKTGESMARFGGPMGVGAPGTIWGADPDYQSLGKGKLRAWQIATGGSEAEQGVAEGAAVSERGDPLPGMPEAAPSVNGMRMDDHEHPSTGMCQVCYSRMFEQEPEAVPA